MKKSKYALLSLTFIIILLVALTSYFKIDKTVGLVEENVVSNDALGAATCSKGPGVYYRTTANYKFRKTPNGDVINTISAGTRITVYCIINGWARATYGGSDGYISTGGIEVVPVSVTSGDIEKTPSVFYRDKDYRGSLDITVNNLPSDGASRLTMTIIDSSGNNAEGSFNVTKGAFSSSNNKAKISFTKNSSDVQGTYHIIAKIDGVEKLRKSFTVEKNEFNFGLTNYSSSESVAENEDGTWIISLKDPIPASLSMENFDYKIMIGGTDVTNKFNVSLNTEGNLVVKNKMRNIGYENGEWKDLTDDYTREGNYTLNVTLKNNLQSNYSNRNGFTKTTPIVIQKRKKKFEENNSERDFKRYQIDYTTENYNVDILGMATVDGVRKYILNEHSADGRTTVQAAYSRIEMEEIYPNIILNDIYIENRVSYTDPTKGYVINPVGVNSANLIFISKYTANAASPEVTYYDITSSTPKTVTKDTFKSENPTAYNQLTSGIYKFDGNGNILYPQSGIGTKLVKHITVIPQKQPLAITGGETTLKIEFSGYLSSELQNFKAELAKMNANQKEILISQAGVVYDASFSMTIDSSKMSEGTIYITIKYTSNKDKYFGDYRVNFGFGNLDSETSFKLENGATDYTVYSEVDPAATSQDPLLQNIPPSNKKYDYNIGLYLKKARTDYYNVNLDSIGYQIFDKRVDKDSQNRYYFYDEIEYIVKVNRIASGNVYYNLSTDNGVSWQQNQVATISQFASDYSEAYQYFSDYQAGATTLTNYNLDASGNIISDNYSMHPVRMFAATPDATDMSLTYVDAAGVTQTVVMNTDFKRSNATIYSLISTRFSYDGNGNYILGAIRGRRKVNIEYNASLASHDFTDQFYIKKAERILTADNKSTEDEIQKELEEITKKTLTIVPKTEVEPKEYFIYVTHDMSDAIGFLYTDNSEDSAIELALYPELYNRNIHMTSITYEPPAYNVTIDLPIESNSITNASIAYANIESQLMFNLVLNYIYDTDNFNFHIEYKNGNSWVNADSYFNSNPFFIPTEAITNENYETKGLSQSTLQLSTIPGTTKKGTYRLVFDYQKDGYRMNSVVKEFEIRANYYGININPDEVVKITADGEERFDKFYSNLKTNIKIPIHLSSVDKPNNIEFELIHHESGSVNAWNQSTKQFISHKDDKKVSFSYTYQVEKGEDDTSTYIMNFKNYYGTSAPEASEGTYTLTARYQETGGELAETSYTFTVSEPKRDFNALLTKDRAVSRANEMFITREIESSYIVGSRLVGNEISYGIEMYDRSLKRYVDVSSENADLRLFERIEMTWKETDVIDRINYYGDMKINLAMDKVDRIFDESDNKAFILVITLANVRYEMEMPNLRELFKWNIESVDITGVFDNDGEDIDVIGYYNNAHPKLDVKLKTIHEENAKYAITNVCPGTSACSPNENMINFNDRFNLISQTNDRIIVKQKDDLADNLKLEKGEYQFIVYYSETDYDIYDFTVKNEYASIEFGEIEIKTPVKGEITNELFVNKDSTIRIPVKVIGVPYQSVTLDITDNDQSTNYNHVFNLDKDKFYNDHVIEIIYDSKNPVEPLDYLIMASKMVDEEVVEDHEVFKFNATYFNYIITNTTYNPNPAIPNLENGGEIIFDVTTDELLSGDVYDDRDIKQEFVNNIRISHPEMAGDLTNLFEISYQDTASVTDFKVVLRYKEESRLGTGRYNVDFSISKDSYTKRKTEHFYMGDYEKRLNITHVEVKSNTKDDLIHKNTGGTYIVNYTSNYDIAPANLFIRVEDSEKNDVTSKFNINKDTYGRVNLEFDPELHSIDYGIYQVTLTYADPDTHTNNVNSTEITMYGDYKEITIKDLNSSVRPILAENDNQYYNFTLDTSNLTEDEIRRMKMRIYDAENNIVYSNIDSDECEGIFDVIKEDDSTYKVNILPYKARVGSYFIELILPEAFELFNLSNKLELTVDATLYTVNLESNSKVETMERINDKDDIYDYIGINGLYNFTSTSPIKDEYSIKIFNKLSLIKEINVDSSTVNNLESLEFSADEISNGEVEFALCIRGLPYVSITKEVLEYIKVSEFAIILNNKDVIDELTLDPGDVLDFELFIKPDNATNKNLVFISDNTDIATFEGNRITVHDKGTTKITVKNKEISQIFTLNVNEYLTSNVYEVDQTNKTIFVNHMTSKRMPRSEFVRNLINLNNNYMILDKNNNNITYTAEVIGTGYKIVSGNITYTVIVIGDVNGDGNISLVDATQVYRYYRGYENFNDIKRKAAIVTRGNEIRLVDATKLYRFYRGDENAL